jgi:general secretion pathway protein M
VDVDKKENVLYHLYQRSGIDSLSLREKWVLAGGLVFVVGFVLIQFAVIPFIDARDARIKSISKKQAELVKINELRKEYLALKTEEDTIQTKIAKRDKSFTLFTFLDLQAGKAGVKKKIKYMKPSVIEGEDLFDEMMVEMKLQQVTLESLVNFLRLVESEDLVVFISRVSIQESGGDGGALDSILQIVTFRPRENG